MSTWKGEPEVDPDVNPALVLLKEIHKAEMMMEGL